MADSTATGPGSCEAAAPINILRVSHPEAPSGILLYSGITTHTVMGPAKVAGRSLDGNTVKTECRATQTDNNENDVSSKNLKKFNSANFKGRVTAQTWPLNLKQQNIKGKVTTPKVKPHSCLATTGEGDWAKTSFKNRQTVEKLMLKAASKFNLPQQSGCNSQRNQSTYSNYQRLSTKKAHSALAFKGQSNVMKSEVYHCNIEANEEHIKNNNQTKTLTGDDGTSEDKSHTNLMEQHMKNKEKVGHQNTMKEKEKIIAPFEVTDKQYRETIQPNVSDNKENNQQSSDMNLPSNSQTVEQKNDVMESPPTQNETGEEICPDTNSIKLSCTKTAPIISWQESNAEGRPTSSRLREIPVSLYSSMFEQGQRPAPHNLPPAPRLLIPPRHTCPEGLTSKDIIQGVCINPGSIMSSGKIMTDEGHDEESKKEPPCGHHDNISVRRVKSAMVVPHFNTTDMTVTNNRHSFLNYGLSPRPSTCTPTPSDRVVSLELSITPLGPDRSQQNKSLKQKHDNGELDHPKLDTMEAIKRSYHRAQSAPPLASRCEGVQTSENTRLNSNLSQITQTGLDDGRKFSSPYWRARSAYHRRNFDAREGDASDINSTGFSSATIKEQESSALKGTLLRPLLYTSESGLMKHSAGCPYKCKNCFRACLVSDDFAQKAQHRRQKLISKFHEPDEIATSRLGSTSKRTNKNTNYRRYDALSIVHRALARSQPLFQRVYGVKGHPQVILPWPSYAWVDIKQKKIGKDVETTAKDMGHDDAF
ncbi:hypothetical protein RRG08_023240 [Elysia crispata]|uniref:Uncharacterized protein n=1 Tax=Elysia crispata TaxID=231223 RepID=A0AAE0ZPT1_9GAST|nr:hypothetical protein RRG08_023240 [Elysia crispata]